MVVKDHRIADISRMLSALSAAVLAQSNIRCTRWLDSCREQEAHWLRVHRKRFSKKLGRHDGPSTGREP